MLYNIIFTFIYNFFPTCAFTMMKLFLSQTRRDVRPTGELCHKWVLYAHGPLIFRSVTIQPPDKDWRLPAKYLNRKVTMKHFIKKVVLAYFENCAQVYTTAKWPSAKKKREKFPLGADAARRLPFLYTVRHLSWPAQKLLPARYSMGVIPMAVLSGRTLEIMALMRI